MEKYGINFIFAVVVALASTFAADGEMVSFMEPLFVPRPAEVEIHTN